MTTSRIEAIAPISDLECWELLSTTDVGRLAIRTGEGVSIVPVNYLVKDHRIVFSSAPGAKLQELTEHPNVAFEADGIHERDRWSVVVQGGATRLSFDTDIEQSGVRTLPTMTPVDKWNYVRITPTSLTGRRFRATHHLS